EADETDDCRSAQHGAARVVRLGDRASADGEALARRWRREGRRPVGDAVDLADDVAVRVVVERDVECAGGRDVDRYAACRARERRVATGVVVEAEVRRRGREGGRREGESAAEEREE